MSTSPHPRDSRQAFRRVMVLRRSLIAAIILISLSPFACRMMGDLITLRYYPGCYRNPDPFCHGPELPRQQSESRHLVVEE